jgi:hypothetical protein
MSDTATPTERELDELGRDCEYSCEGEDAGYPVDDSVDGLIAYKDALEDRAYREGAVLDRINAWLSEREWASGPALLEDICAQIRTVRPEQTKAEREALEPDGHISH